MRTTHQKIAVLVALACGLLGSAGCQDMHKESVQLAEARWSRARAAVMLQLAEQQYKAGQLDKAQVTVGQAVNLDPSFPRLHTLRGQILAEKGQGQQAVAAYELANAMDPQDPQPYYYSGVQYEKWGQFDKALVKYQAACNLAPANVSYAVAVAETLGQLDRYDEAMALVEQVLANQSQSVALRVTAGELCQAHGDHARSAKYFRDAARLATDDNAILRSLAMALYRAGSYEEARGYLEQLANQRPSTDPATPPSSGVLMLSSTSDASAKPAADSRGACPPDRAEVLAALGECYLQTSMPQRARDVFAELTRACPKWAGGWEGLAKVAVHQRRWEEAIASADKALAVTPDSSSAWLIRGYALVQLGRNAEAAEVFKRAHRLAPKDTLMLCLLADSLRRAGNFPAAREALVRAVQIAPADPLANRMMNELASADQGKSRPGVKADEKPLAPPTVTAGVHVPE